MSEAPTNAASGTLTPVLSTRTVADAVTNTTTTVTSATAAFVAGDVGRRVTGHADFGVFNYIASVTNGTTALLAVAEVGSGTGRSLTLSQEFVFPFTVSAACVLQHCFDKTNLASGDVGEWRAYRTFKSGGTPRVSYFERIVEAQSADDIGFEGPMMMTPFTDPFALAFTWTQTKGTARALDWFLAQA